MRRIILYVLAAIIGASVGLTGIPLIWLIMGQPNHYWNKEWINGFIGTFIFLVIIFLFMNSILSLLEKLDSKIAELNLSKGIFIVVGVIIGLLVGLLFSIPITMLQIPIFSNVVAALVIIFFGYFGYLLFNRRGEEIVRVFRQGRKTEEQVKSKSKFKNKREFTAKLLDTSVIIDGRIFDILSTGFLEGEIIIPNFVLLELQALSDSNDSLKRAKGRRGLDLVNKLQQNIEISISDKDYKGIKEVDSKLLRYASESSSVLVTNDYNLNKLSEIQGIKVLNINDLANAVKQQVMVMEELTVTIVKEGTERQQGIAYLPDGTMVVVEESKKLIGKTVETTVTKVLQTSAGRMIFAELR
ncbi:MAG: PIN/TRAM domain-containing protein [Lactovum sp.]